jgi:hypothetical protein
LIQFAQRVVQGLMDNNEFWMFDDVMEFPECSEEASRLGGLMYTKIFSWTRPGRVRPYSNSHYLDVRAFVAAVLCAVDCSHPASSDNKKVYSYSILQTFNWYYDNYETIRIDASHNGDCVKSAGSCEVCRVVGFLEDAEYIMEKLGWLSQEKKDTVGYLI